MAVRASIKASAFSDPVPFEPMLTSAEAADMLGITTRQLRYRADAGELAAVRTPSNQRRYPLAQVRVLRGLRGAR
jgi:DNA-binding transcriptional MerR regulator